MIEAIIKLIGFGRSFFRENWNIFDFVIVLGSILLLMFKFIFKIDFSMSTQVIRALRIGRIFKLFRNLQAL